jgi:hypothetical protein
MWDSLWKATYEKLTQRITNGLIPLFWGFCLMNTQGAAPD